MLTKTDLEDIIQKSYYVELQEDLDGKFICIDGKKGELIRLITKDEIALALNSHQYLAYRRRPEGGVEICTVENVKLYEGSYVYNFKEID